MPLEVNFESHMDDVLKEKEEIVEQILEEWGLYGQGRATDIITAESRVDTDTLRGSIAYQTDLGEKATYIGTNVEYAIFNEIGTGIYTDGGGGRQTPWRYQDRHGNWYTTRGMKGIHFLRDAIQNHIDQYKLIMEEKLKGI